MLVLCQVLHTKLVVQNPGEIGSEKGDVLWHFSYIYQEPETFIWEIFALGFCV